MMVFITALAAIVLSGLALPAYLYCQSPDNYPLPPGPPDDWRVPGRSEPLVPTPVEPSDTQTMMNAPGQGNQATNRPNMPAGEAYER